MADVAGGQGLLARMLIKRHNLECDVVDPRGALLGREDFFGAVLALVEAYERGAWEAAGQLLLVGEQDRRLGPGRLGRRYRCCQRHR